MRCPRLDALPPAPEGRTGWPWTEESAPLPDAMPDGGPWPRVSIVTPVYNQAAFLEEAIRSVLLQGYPDLEYIIVDGGSTDGCVDIIRKYEPWLAHWRSEPDRGQSHAINKGLRRATGRYFNWHNADDVLLPGALSLAARALAEHPQASYAYGYSLVIDEKSAIIPGRGGACHEPGVGFVRSVEESLRELRSPCQPGCLMDAKTVFRVGMLDERLHYTMDGDLLLRLNLVAGGYSVAQPVVMFRSHQRSKTATRSVRRGREPLLMAHRILANPRSAKYRRHVRRPMLARAHHIAWQNLRAVGRRREAAWHGLLETLYAPPKPIRKAIRAILLCLCDLGVGFIPSALRD